MQQCALGAKEDPLNFIARASLGGALLNVRRVAEAQSELRRSLEFEENHPSVSFFLALACVRQGNWTEALHIAEKASPVNAVITGTLAGLLKRVGKVNRAEELIQKLMSGKIHDYDVPIGLSVFHFLNDEMDRAAEWWEKVIEQRNPVAPNFGSVVFRSTSQWPRLAKLMNLWDSL